MENELPGRLFIFIKPMFFKNFTLQNLVTGVLFSSKWHVTKAVGKSHCLSCFIKGEELPQTSPVL